MPTKRVTFKGTTVEFETDDAGVISVKDGGKKVLISEGPGGIGKLVKGGKVDLSGLNITSIAEGTVIVTRHNPTCFWYFFAGTWHVYCC